VRDLIPSENKKRIYDDTKSWGGAKYAEVGEKNRKVAFGYNFI
jgi:hypothetical protein